MKPACYGILGYKLSEINAVFGLWANGMSDGSLGWKDPIFCCNTDIMPWSTTIVGASGVALSVLI